MARTGKIAPIIKQYGDEINTLDQQLAKHGYNRAPGTVETLFPFKERTGRYRTGLDVNAPYIKRMSEEDAAAEIKRINETKARLEEVIGIPGILNSNSLFYNYAASPETLKKAFGTSEYQVTPVKLGDKETFFNTSEIHAEIAWNWLKVHPRIAPSLDSVSRGEVPQDVKYYVVDDEAESRQTFNKKKEVNKAITEFEKLTPTKQKQIGRLMGLPVTDSSTEEVVYNLIDSALKDTEFKSGKNKGASPIRLFNELLKMTPDRLRIKDLVEQALTHNIYRYGLNHKIVEGQLPVADSLENLVEYLLDDEHQVDVIALEQKLKGKLIEKL